MFSLKSEKRKIEPIVFIDNFLQEKMQELSETNAIKYSDHAFLAKYFPKYYRHLSFMSKELTGALESKIKRLKIVKTCFDKIYPRDDEKIFKKYFRTNRKTLKEIPKVGDYDVFQHHSLCTYFPGVKDINLKQNKLQEMYYDKQLYLNKSTLKGIYSSFGYFWSGCRFVESLKVRPHYEFELAIIKKMDSSKRFLSFLKKLELEILTTVQNNARKFLIELLKNRNFLRHVTHLEIGDFSEKRFYWKPIQSFINCCPQLCSLSFSTGNIDKWNLRNQEDLINEGFCLNLSCLQNLRVLDMRVNHFRTFINRIQFPPFIREISLRISDSKDLGSLKEFFDCQEEIEDNGMIEEQDMRDWESFEKSRMLGEFFGKWKKLENLRILDLSFYDSSDIDTLVRNFVLPLLRATPNLETLCYQFRYQQAPQGGSRLIDLEEFFSGIEPLKSLKHFKIWTDVRHNCVFSGLYHPQKLSLLSNLSSIELDVEINFDFDLKKFLSVFLCSKDNLGLNNQVIKKDLKLPRLKISSTQFFIRLLNLMHSASDFKNFQANLQITLAVESLDDIYSNFKYPIYVPSNIQLTVEIQINNVRVRAANLTFEEKQYFEMIFGQLKLARM